MIFAHLPAGYLLARAARRYVGEYSTPRATLCIASCLGSIAPDIDFLYFYLVDHRQHHHHAYFTHYPLFWLGLLGLALLGRRISDLVRWGNAAILFCLSGLVHLLLDGSVGIIWWLAPLTDMPPGLLIVHAKNAAWWSNYLLHGTFVFELPIIALAVFMWRRSVRTPAVGATQQDTPGAPANQ